MKKKVDLLTNEGIRHLFANNFDLANFAIKLARSKLEHDHCIVLNDVLNDLNLMAEGKKEIKIEEAPAQREYDE